MGMFERLGETITVLRILRGVSQAELADRCGIRANQISRYETGQVLPQLAQLERLLDALEVGLPEFLFAMSHLERTARLLDDAERLPAETLVRDSVATYWRQVTDLHLEMSRQVARVVRERMQGDGDGRPSEPSPPPGAGDGGSSGGALAAER